MKPFTLNLHGRLVAFGRPAVMSIINATPDSFYAASRCAADDDVAAAVEKAIGEGTDIIDLGAYSSRPGAADVPPEEELERLARALRIVRRIAPDIPVSVDTFRAPVARECCTSLGADIVNDISGGDLDPAMFDTVAALGVPYILMHTRGTPATMQTLTDYPGGVVPEVIRSLAGKLRRLQSLGVADVMVDPGFGFAKTMEQNYRMLASLDEFAALGRPVLVGVSRKSMLTRLLGITAGEALPATVAANTVALMHGASVLRVHDTAAGRHAVDITSYIESCSRSE